MSNLDFIYKRHSVRTFTDEVVKPEDLEAIIQAATYAPSGKNLQNWHFVVIKNKEKIQQIVTIVEEKNAELATYLRDEDKQKAFRAALKYNTAFRGAPMLILVYAGPYPTLADDLLEFSTLDKAQALEYTKPNPGIQNIGAAIQNLQLAAANLGYGTCWMTGPTYADKEISEYLGFTKPGFYLAAMSTLGVPAKTDIKNPPRKAVESVMTIID